MYQELWDRVPGDWRVKLLGVFIVVVIVIYVLLEIVFPAIGPMLPGSNVQVVS